MNPWHTKRLTINQEKLRYLQKKQSTNDNTSEDRYTQRAIKISTVSTEDWVDYLGPVTMRIERRNGEPCFCLFNCPTMRAAQIGVVSKLDTDSCLNAIKLSELTDVSTSANSRSGQKLPEVPMAPKNLRSCLKLRISESLFRARSFPNCAN